MSNVGPRSRGEPTVETGRPSEARRALARQLIATCPPSLGSEIALTGSAARGTSDDYSDVELNFWCDGLPTLAERADWLRGAGATDVTMDFDTIPDGTVWSMLRWRGIWIEAGWQTIGKTRQSLQDVLAAATTDHDLLLLPWMLGQALPLRTNGLLEIWRQAVSRYPEELSDRLIESAIAGWLWPSWVAARWALVERGESLALAQQLVDDARSALRILFAINREWEPDWKWTKVETGRLERKPDRLLDRLEAIHGAADPARRVATCLELILDVLALAPATESIRRATAVVGSSLVDRSKSGPIR